MKRKKLTGAPNGERMPTLRMDWKVLKKVIRTIGCRPAEAGGVIGARGGDGRINHYFFDETSSRSEITYSPDHLSLNNFFEREWNPRGIRLQGFIHSHPGSMTRPSHGDRVYAERIIRAIEDLECLWLPIINTIPNSGSFRLTPWAFLLENNRVSLVQGRVDVRRSWPGKTIDIDGFGPFRVSGTGWPAEEILVRPAGGMPIAPRLGPARVRPPIGENPAGSLEQTPETAKTPAPTDNTFERVRDAYDLGLMSRTTIFAVGLGGAAEWLEQMARAGAGRFILVDPDTVSETNLATQQVYRRDIGRAKAECVAERIRDINPAAEVLAIRKPIEALSDQEIARLARTPACGRETRTTLVCGFTDDFPAQARVNRIALNLGLPSLCAQVYERGLGGEITFTYPGVTPACHRCVLSSRYEHFLDRRQVNNVTSHGTPVFATARLNALKGFLALAIIHHGSDHPRWGKMLESIGKRSLVQVRMDPRLGEEIGIDVFERVFERNEPEKVFFDETVWLPQECECPGTGYPYCPDCGGTGDLRYAIGKFTDTRVGLPSPGRKGGSDETVHHGS